MILTLQTHGHQTLEEVRRFLSGNEAVDFVLRDRVSAYAFIVETLVRFRYRALPQRDKGSIRAYVMKMTGKSESQVTRLIRQYLDTGRLRDRRGAQAHAFRRRYPKADIGVRAEVDAWRDTRTILSFRASNVTRTASAAATSTPGAPRYSVPPPPRRGPLGRYQVARFESYYDASAFSRRSGTPAG